ncbi:MAG: hypothetical protein WD005_03830 [Haliea sp.]
MTEEQNRADLADGKQVDDSAKVQKIEPSASGNEQSKIEFPYHDLESAEGIVRSIFNNAGEVCTLDQLAAYMNQSMKSGAFRLRVSNARIFGLTENQSGEVRLTEMAKRLVDDAQAPQARVDAFLHVPLYAKVYENYKGYTIPPAAGLEKFMAEVGVSSKQTDKARQAFMRSARQAGFFAQGDDRLVQPALHNPPPTKPLDEKPPEVEDKPGGGGGGGFDGGKGVHPAIVGVLQTLPEPNANWSLRQRAKWLSALSNIFDLIYEGDEGDIEIRVEKSDVSLH